MADELKIDRPVTGDVNYSDRKVVPQLGPQEFLAEIDRALAVPGVVGLVWEQYTPYFNDGEPCEFSIRSDVRVLIDGDDYDPDSEERDYDRGVSTYDTYGDKYPYNRDLDTVDWKTLGNGVSGRAVYELLRSFDTSAWESVAKANFGDHAQVTATSEGFNVEYYEHD